MDRRGRGAPSADAVVRTGRPRAPLRIWRWLGKSPSLERARVAQPDRALASGARGRGFESRRAHQSNPRGSLSGTAAVAGLVLVTSGVAARSRGHGAQTRAAVTPRTGRRALLPLARHSDSRDGRLQSFDGVVAGRRRGAPGEASDPFSSISASVNPFSCRHRSGARERGLPRGVRRSQGHPDQVPWCRLAGRRAAPAAGPGFARG